MFAGKTGSSQVKRFTELQRELEKEAKRKARIEQRRAKRSISSSKQSEEKLMHDIDKPITLEDLTNPDKN